MIQNFASSQKYRNFSEKRIISFPFDVAPLVVEETWPDNRSQW